MDCLVDEPGIKKLVYYVSIKREWCIVVRIWNFD